jgi:hypothetical protein
MIYYLATRAYQEPIRGLLDRHGENLRNCLVPLKYEDLFAEVADEAWWQALQDSWWAYPLEPDQAEKLPQGHYIFADYDRLSPSDATRAAVLWQTLHNRPGTRLLNHPTRSMSRYELLRTLYERGINSFDVYRLTEARWPRRYPVILRTESGHDGNKFPLLHSRSELDAALAMVYEHGQSRDDILLVEFCDSSDTEGLYHRYTAFCIAGRVVPKSLYFANDWLVRRGELAEEEMMAEEWAYLRDNPHERGIRQVFELAHIDYGRIDYALLEGRIQVWEINSNPWVTTTESTQTRRRVADLVEPQFEAALQEFGNTTLA